MNFQAHRQPGQFQASGQSMYCQTRHPMNFQVQHRQPGQIQDSRQMMNFFSIFKISFSVEIFFHMMSKTHAKFHDHMSRGFGCGGANTQTQSGIYYIDDLTKPNPKTFN